MHYFEVPKLPYVAVQYGCKGSMAGTVLSEMINFLLVAVTHSLPFFYFINKKKSTAISEFAVDPDTAAMVYAA